jgi:hypothetical protein
LIIASNVIRRKDERAPLQVDADAVAHQQAAFSFFPDSTAKKEERRVTATGVSKGQ